MDSLAMSTSQITHVAPVQWRTLSFEEQMGHIGGEVGRARRWRIKDPSIFEQTADRALALFDQTFKDDRWRDRRNEVRQARERFCIAASAKDADALLEQLETHLLQFARSARRDK